MNLLKKSLLVATIISMSTTFSNAFTSVRDTAIWHQQGLEEDNTRLSVALWGYKPDEGDSSLALYTVVGKLISKDIEVLLDTRIITFDGESIYRLGGGANYYLKYGKSDSFTPYAGAEIGYNDSTIDYYDSYLDDSVYVGAHKFLNTKTAISPEAGFEFKDLVDYEGAYIRVFLTYFFDTNSL